MRSGSWLLASLSLTVMLAGVGCDGGTSRSVFDDPSCVNSPDGSVPAGARAYSPDGRFYAQEIEPIGFGSIGIYSRASGTLDHEVHVLAPGEGNFLKAMAWSRDSQYLAVLYHGSLPVAGPALYHVSDGVFFKQVGADLGVFYHFMVFSPDGNSLYLATTSGAVQLVLVVFP